MRLSVTLAFCSLGGGLSAQGPALAFRGDFRIGSTISLDLDDQPGSGYALALATGLLVQPIVTPLGPWHLDASALVIATGTMAANRVSVPLAIPNDPWLVGARIHAQGFTTRLLLSATDDFVIGNTVQELTEKNAARWTAGADDGSSTFTLADDPVTKRVGATSVRWQTGAPFLAFVQYPDTRNASWDLRGNTHLELQVLAQNPNPNGFQGQWPVVRLGDRDGAWFQYAPSVDYLNQARTGWITLRIPLGGDAIWTVTQKGTPSLARIDWLELQGDTWDSGFTLWLDGLAFVPAGVARPFAPSLDAPDLDVGYVERLPRYLRYSVAYPAGVPTLVPGTESEKRWPAPSENVTFRAHLRNPGRRASGPIAFAWSVDGQPKQTGTLSSLPPGGAATHDFVWSWQGGRHLLRFAATPVWNVAQVATANDALELASDALTFGFTIEQSVFARLDATPNRYGSFSATGWLQAQLAHMTELFTTSTYSPVAPNGALQRVRIDKLTLVPDGTLGSFPPEDREVDGQWGFPVRTLAEYMNHATLANQPLLHELSHQLGLVDLYQLNLAPANNLVNGKEFYQADGGLMGGGSIAPHSGGTYYASHDVFGLNVTLGSRRGYYGEYFFALPQTCVLALADLAGPLPNTNVRIYQTQMNLLDATPEITGTTDANGELTLPNRTCPTATTATGLTLRPNPFATIDVVGRNGLFLVEALTASGSKYAFLPITDLNLAWASGATGRHVQPIQVR